MCPDVDMQVASSFINWCGGSRGKERKTGERGEREREQKNIMTSCASVGDAMRKRGRRASPTRSKTLNPKSTPPASLTAVSPSLPPAFPVRPILDVKRLQARYRAGIGAGPRPCGASENLTYNNPITINTHIIPR